MRNGVRRIRLDREPSIPAWAFQGIIDWGFILELNNFMQLSDELRIAENDYRVFGGKFHELS